MVKPPPKMTVTMTITEVVVRMRRRADVAVLRMAKANAIAPRRPENRSKCCIFLSILFFSDRDKLMRNERG